MGTWGGVMDLWTYGPTSVMGDGGAELAGMEIGMESGLGVINSIEITFAIPG